MLTSFRRFLGFHREAKPPSMETPEPTSFFSALDRFQQDAYDLLRLRYPGYDAFCKLTAIKAANAFAAGYHFRYRHTRLVSRPVHLQVDPTNVCHMRCPSCLHTANSAWASRFDWPAATLGIKQFDEFCDQFGPFATKIALFRDGEPLLHRRFPELVSLAKNYLLYTLISTSLSMRIDADALVASGLDRLVAAIDGVATYDRYRRGGDFDLVIENLRAIVKARKDQSIRKPWLVWQFLAFEHNVHEVEAAVRLAREIGLDQFVLARPHSVEHDDPSIKVAKDAPFGEILFAEPAEWCTAVERGFVARRAERIESAFRESWVARFERIGGEGMASPEGFACRWLYFSLTMDGARRITPCCLPPMGPPEPRHLVFAEFNGRNVDEVVNSFDATLARQETRRGRPLTAELNRPSPYCITCTAHPLPPMLPDVAEYLREVDERRALPGSVHAALGASPLFAWRPGGDWAS